MKSTKYVECIGVLILLSSFLSTLGNPLSGLGGEKVQYPFGDCEIYELGGNGGNPFIEEKSVKIEPVFSFYPLTDEPIALSFLVFIDGAVLKVNVKGTMITIEKCEQYNRNCIIENTEAVKHVDYIKPHQWNEVRLNLDSNKMEIFISDRKVLSKTMEGYDMESDEIYWKLESKQNDRKQNDEKEGKTNDRHVLYLVQFQCPGFEDSSSHVNFGNKPPFYHHEPTDFTRAYESTPIMPIDDHKPDEKTPILPRDETNTHTEDPLDHPVTNSKSSTKPFSQPPTGDHHQSKQSSGRGRQAGLIVGLVILGIIIITLVIIIINIIRKSRSMSLNETSPLSTEQQQQETNN